MSFTPIAHGTPDWDGPLNAALTQMDQSITNLSLNVKSFGAVGNGVANDSPAIQAAINQAAVTGGPVFFPAGTYIIGASLSIPAVEGLIIQGTGWGSSLKLAAGVNDYVMRFTGSDTRVTIRDLEIDGNHLQQTGASGGIFANGAVSCRFDNLHFTFCRDDALYLGPQNGAVFGHNNRVIGCLFDQSTGSAGPGRGIHTDSSDENQIIACDFEYLGGAGTNPAAIYDQAGTQFIQSCNFVNGGHDARGVHVQDTKSTKIEGCNFDGLAGDNVFIAGQRCAVNGNTFFSPGIAGTAGQASAIYLEFANANNVVTNNVITSAPGANVSRGAIRESSNGGGGNNTIAYNQIITAGSWSFGPLDLSGTNSRYVGNDGGGRQDTIDTLSWQPNDQGFIGWTSDPVLAGSTGSSLTAGTVFMNAVPIRRSMTLNAIAMQIITAGATLTAGQNFAAVYNAAGTQVAITADQSSNWTSTGYKSMAVTTPVVLTPGIYYVALLANGTTPPQPARGNVVSGAWYNANLSNAALRTSSGGTGLTGLTALPATITMSNRGSGATALWHGLL